jgi:16S rRNA (adenine1518-N6/adenine1519-N6)-dimethyltransferase
MRKRSHAKPTSHQAPSRYRKRFGQVFLRDTLVVEQIVARAQIAPGDTVLEIGPGRGALTGALAGRAEQLYALEIEAPFIEALQQRFADRPHVHLIQADARRYDYEQLPHPLIVVANLPYSTATHILRHLFTYRRRLSRLIVMVQKEVAERFAAATGSKSYSGLSVFFQYYAALECCLDVPPQAFSPQPAVHSTVLRMEPFATPPYPSSDESFLFQLVKCAFAHRRKTLRKNLLAVSQWGLSDADLAAIWADLALASTARPQELNPAQFVALAEAVRPLAARLTPATPHDSTA